MRWLAPTRLALGLLAGLGLLTCAEPPPAPPAADAPRHVDLLIEDRVTPSASMVEAFCGDEHRWSRPLADGDELTARFELNKNGRLLVGGCIGRPGEKEREEGLIAARHLEVTVSPASAEQSASTLRMTLPLPAYSGRWSEELDLAALPAGATDLRLRVTLPEGRELYLRDLGLRHQAPAPLPLAAAASTQPGQARQILLISVDTLRADALSALGGPWPTPQLDRFAAASQVWAPHYAAAAWTKPSHASLLTGQSPVLHGASKADTVIDPAVPLLSHHFGRAGFLTKGLTFDCTWLRPKFGFSRGFDEYQVVPWTLPQMARQAVDWMARHRDRPFFFFFHTFDVHSDFHRLPYEAPGVRLATVEQRFGIPAYGCREGACASNLLEAIDAGRIEPLPGEEEILRFLYGQGVAHLDESLGLLFRELEEIGLFDSMLIVFTSDHGESFLEHGEVLHGNPWNEVIRVPLLVKWPGGALAGDRQSLPSSALDVAPTLLAAAGLPTDGLPGVDLRTYSTPRPVFTWGPWRVVATPEWKAVLGDPREERLFHLASDPLERENLVAREPGQLARLQRIAEARGRIDLRIAEELGGHGEGEQRSPLSEEEIRRLEALGYLGDS